MLMTMRIARERKPLSSHRLEVLDLEPGFLNRNAGRASPDSAIAFG